MSGSIEMLASPHYRRQTDELLAQFGDTSGIPTLGELRASRVGDPDPRLAGEPAPVARSELWLPTRAGACRAFVYRSGPGTAPLMLWLHGGGFIGGSLEDIDTSCSHLAQESAATVVSLDYRLAPEHPYPAGLLDAYDALAWLRSDGAVLGGDGRVWAGGQSAGAALVAGATLLARDLGEASADRQVLCYPSLDFDRRTESSRAFDGVFLHSADSAWIARQYLAGQPVTPYAAPLRAPALAGLPSALVIGAGRDPLRDDARTYAERLAEAAVPVRYVEVSDTMHAFLNFPGVLSAAHDVIALIADHLIADHLGADDLGADDLGADDLGADDLGADDREAAARTR